MNRSGLLQHRGERGPEVLRPWTVSRGRGATCVGAVATSEGSRLERAERRGPFTPTRFDGVNVVATLEGKRCFGDATVFCTPHARSQTTRTRRASFPPVL